MHKARTAGFASNLKCRFREGDVFIESLRSRQSHWAGDHVLQAVQISAKKQRFLDTTMKAIRFTLVSFCLVQVCTAAGSAQTAGKPVLSPPPAPAGTSAPVPDTANAAAAGPVNPATYVIGADDQIQVTVWQNPQLSGSFVVRPDGKISLPLVNDVQAAGFTPMQLTADLTDRFKKFVNDPTVGVTVLSVKSKNVYMMGEVGHVGPIPMAPGMTVLQAIATAGGLTPFANSKKIYILRGTAPHQQQIHFDYKTAIRKGDMQGVTLQPGDTIVVP